jgi:hypothetical protein
VEPRIEGRLCQFSLGVGTEAIFSSFLYLVNFVLGFVYLTVKLLDLSIYGVGYHTPDVLANESNPITK